MLKVIYQKLLKVLGLQAVIWSLPLPYKVSNIYHLTPQGVPNLANVAIHESVFASTFFPQRRKPKAKKLRTPHEG